MKKQVSRKVMTLFSTLFLLVALNTACESEQQKTQTNAQGIPVNVKTAKKINIPEDYQFSGTVRGSQQVKLSTKMRGKVTQLSVEEGDLVSQGEMLVRIKDQNVRAQKHQVEARLAEARANLQNTQTNLERIKALHKSGSATQKRLDDIQTKYRSAQSQVQALKSRLSEVEDMLDYTKLRAPFDGFVAKKRISKGDMASPGRPLLTVEDFGRAEVVASVPESQINLFTLQDTVKVSITATGYKQLSGTVKQINLSGSSASRQFKVKVDVPLPEDISRIKSGMFATVHLRKSGKPSIAVPQNAIIQRGQLNGLYTVSPDKEAVLRWVRTGQTHNDRIEILSGLAAGEQYVAQFKKGEIKQGKQLKTQ